MKIAFLDRDGTIIEDYEDEKWREIEKPVFLKGAIEALKIIKQKGYEIIIVTNQYLINERIITLDQYKKINQRFLNYLKANNIKVLDVFFCPHSKEEKCDCFKPKPGLIKQALEKYPNIDLSNSFIVGDSKSDVKLGKHFNLLCFGINVNNEGCINVESLKEIVKYI
ncbi:HAD-IIIA family hydrolase [Halocella sp. SP3-1]|uniref:D-glycero-alpha-D-manno-heptose-1,7-bisphosphate 7-phosphatase n=1 Tax=Halocella sp. SP3-1 TaxID=2382161 RepID=UPI000F74E372|nr:HAD-IIIA family hydrolase [Halocella sp. SP3-1]AZO95122.1 HAD-IIIA family hydrolase [Halocella sp. SP3-1]